MTITFKDEEGGESSSIVEDFATGFVVPIDVAVDSHGRLYVADYGGTKFIASPGMLHKINVAGAALTLGRGDANP